MYKFINGGVCAAKGFKASGIHVGVKTNNKKKKDLALIVSDCGCEAAAIYTKNIVKAAPLCVTMKHLSDGRARAIIANSGNANACAPNGEENALRMTKAAAAALTATADLNAGAALEAAEDMKISESDIIVASTGVIGQALPINVITDGMGELINSLDSSETGSMAAADAIMTTDLTRKEAAAEFELGGKKLRIGGIAKGSGMIHPNMGTMLAFLTTDCAISSQMIQKALKDTAAVSFNRVSVDGDTSTNDMLTLMANGLGGNEQITSSGTEYDIFKEALDAICVELAKKMASDGEGAKHLITCTVNGAADEQTAEKLAKSVISSTLVKAAMFGCDANWGRVLCAMGYSGAEFDPETVSISFTSEAGSIMVCKNGRGLDFDEIKAKQILTQHDIMIAVDLSGGNAGCTCWGCDITYDYIKINGDYRT